MTVPCQSRGTFESTLDRPLSEDEWVRLRPHMEGYDEWLDTSGVGESICAGQLQTLQKAGIDDEQPSAWAAAVSGRPL